MSDKAYGTEAQGSPVTCGECINGFCADPADRPKRKITCGDLRQRELEGTIHDRDFSCGLGVSAESYINPSKKEKAPEGKALLQVAHYRMMEIDKAEIDGLADTIRRSGADTCEDAIVQAFFEITKKRILQGRSRRLDDSEVMALWGEFKESISCLFQKEGLKKC
jgi:hypothetical protein